MPLAPHEASSEAPVERDRVCLQCGAIMGGGGCKLRCPRCGYFEDCANLLGINPEGLPPARGSKSECEP